MVCACRFTRLFDRRATLATDVTAPSAIDSSTGASTQQPATQDASESSGNWWNKLVDETHTPRLVGEGKDRIVPPHSRSVPNEGKSRDGDPVVEEPAAAATASDRTTKQLSAEDLYEQVVPSVVTIKVVMDDDGEHIATGSGFFIDKETKKARTQPPVSTKPYQVGQTYCGTPTEYGYVLTNYHVIVCRFC